MIDSRRVLSASLVDAAMRFLAARGAARRLVEVNRLLADEAAAYPVERSHTMGRTGMRRPLGRIAAEAARSAPGRPRQGDTAPNTA
jgi:hypothetical protein